MIATKRLTKQFMLSTRKTGRNRSVRTKLKPNKGDVKAQGIAQGVMLGGNQPKQVQNRTLRNVLQRS